MKICTNLAKRTINWGKDANLIQLFNTKVSRKWRLTMFLLTSALKGFNNSQGSKSKATMRWIVVKVSYLNNVSCLKI